MERFIIPVAAGLVVVLLTKRIHLSPAWRLTAILGIVVLAYVAASFELQPPSHPTTAPPSIALPPTPGSGNVSHDNPPGQVGQQAATAKPRDLKPEPVESDTRTASEGDMFVKRYVVKSSGGSGAPRWGVLIAERDASDFPRLNSAVTEVLSERGYKRVSIFRPTVIQDRKYEDIYAGDPVLTRKLTPYCDAILVGKITSSTSGTNAALNDLLTVEITLDMRLISTSSGEVTKEFRLHENGAGFSHTEARARAEERLATKLRDHLRSTL